MLQFLSLHNDNILHTATKMAMLSVYLSISVDFCRYLSIQKPTSVGQKLPDGWQEMWRSCVKEVLALRSNPEIVEAFNRQRPHEMPVEILPV